MKRIYVDTCIASAIANGELEGSRRDSVSEIFELYNHGHIDLVTSVIMEEELSKIPEGPRKSHQDIYLSLGNIPKVGLVMPSMITLLGVGAGPRVNPIFIKISQIIPGEKDALHIFTAVMNQCTHFLTIDSRTIVKKREGLSDVVEMRIILPEELAS